MTNVQFEEQKAMISLVMAMAVTERLTREGLLEKAENAPTVEEKLEVMKEGAEAIKDELNKAFKDNEKAQEMKRLVQEDLLRHHFAYHGFEYEAIEAGV
nr:hypothetical protein 2 [Bacillaceae bacterium]